MVEALIDTREEGLTAEEVRIRIERGDTNAVKEATSRSLTEILRSNIFTRFNAILGVLFLFIMLFGELNDALFGGVLVGNALIGIIQELRAKITLDRLKIISAPKARVRRDGQLVEIPIGKVVLDDLVEMTTGDQLIADGAVTRAAGLEVDESLLTGESVPVIKRIGDTVFSGSFVVSGTGTFQATAVGVNAYARKLAAEAKRYQVVPSELRDGINMILRYITWIMIPVGSLLFASQMQVFGDLGKAVPGTVAGLVGMVPEGLVLLTSVAFAVSVVALGRRRVLVQELPAVEGLARVNVVCVDKTGTLTSGNPSFKEIVPFGPLEGAPAAAGGHPPVEGPHGPASEISAALGAMGASSVSSSSTLEAIAERFDSPGWEPTGGVAFSSARKWSAESFSGHGTWILGAPEVLIAALAPAEEGRLPGIKALIDEHAAAGERVLMLAHTSKPPAGEELPGEFDPLALVVFEEQVRPDAPDTMRYFTEQGVSIKVISGDNPVTVAAVARRAGVPNVGEPFDARELPDDTEEIARIMERTTVFGRVSPEQKEGMVIALQSRGNAVAMTGDGVNDVLALKRAEIGIAMGSGSPASKAVAQLVLLDGQFSAMPGVVAEGRRVAGNIERVANLFLAKTVYATLISLVIGLANWEFLFLPRHLTLISSVTIGMPAFVLSFGPNRKRCMPGFVHRVLRFALPTGLVMAIGALLAGFMSHIVYGLPFEESRTVATMVLGVLGLTLLVRLAAPFDAWWKKALVLVMCLLFLTAFLLPYGREFFALELPSWRELLEGATVAALGIIVLQGVWGYIDMVEAFRQRRAVRNNDHPVS